jgi:hypothetical protein
LFVSLNKILVLFLELLITEQVVKHTHVHLLYAAPKGALGKRIVTASDLAEE